MTNSHTPDRVTLMENIKNHKWAIIIALTIFTPTSPIIFKTLGYLSNYINWGIATLIGLTLTIRWAYPHARNLAQTILNNDEQEQRWN